MIFTCILIKEYGHNNNHFNKIHAINYASQKKLVAKKRKKKVLYKKLLKFKQDDARMKRKKIFS